MVSFDEIAHSPLMERVRDRIGDKRVLALIKAFLKAGILGQDGAERDTITGTPQGGILSPMLANIALSVLDEHFAGEWAKMGNRQGRQHRRRRGLATCRLVRYADDFVVLVNGTREHAEQARNQAAEVLRPMGLRLSETKTRIAHIDEGFDFLGFRIKRDRKPGTTERQIYTYPSRDALMSVKSKVRALMTRSTQNMSLKVLLLRLNPVLRGWTNYFCHGVSKRTFSYLSAFTWRRVLIWLRGKHARRTVKWLRSRYYKDWWPTEGGYPLFNPDKVKVTRFRYRGKTIFTPWSSETRRSPT